MTEKTRGNERVTEVYAVANEPDRPVRDAARDHGPLVEQAAGDTVDASYTAGRTISLGDFEFVRIAIGARTGRLPGDAGSDTDAFEAIQAFVGEVLAREEALVRRTQREPQPLPPLPGIRRMIWVEYGLTLKAAVRYESHKVDIGLSRPLGDGEDAGAALAAIQEYLAARVAAERDRLRGKE